MSVGKAVFGLLTSDTVLGPLLYVPVAGSVSAYYKVFPVIQPQEVYQNNTIMYYSQSTQGEHTKDGSSTLDTFLVELTCVADTGQECVELAEKARVAMEYKFGDYNGVKVDGCHLDDKQEPLYDADIKKYYVQDRYKLRLKRTGEDIALLAEDDTNLLIN